MNLNTLYEAIPEDLNPTMEGDFIKVNDFQIYQLDDLTFFIDGFSPYSDLPKKFIFGAEAQVQSILVPFILQLSDGERRL